MSPAQSHPLTGRPRHFLSMAAAVAGAALLLAACGSSGKPHRSSQASTGAQLQQARQVSVRFQNCMRSHGVTNLPDDPLAVKQTLTSSSAQAPAVQSAESACAHLLPHGGVSPSPPRTHAQIARILAFARCVRTHGFSTFPDPNTSGQITHEMLANAGIDVRQPAVVQAADACAGVTDGVVTRALIARFVTGR